MEQQIKVKFDNSTIDLLLNDSNSPNTLKQILDSLPFKVRLNLWGEEIYTDKTPVQVGGENSKETVDLHDVAYWPDGNALCLFYGPTPIGKEGEIKPYSPVNIIGKISKPDKSILEKISSGVTEATITK